MKNSIFKLIIKYFNIKGFLTELVTEVIDEALDKVVKNTSNPYDDMAKAALWSPLESEIVKVIEEKIDLEKLLGMNEEVSK